MQGGRQQGRVGVTLSLRRYLLSHQDCGTKSPGILVPRLLIGRTGVDERSVPCDHRAGTPSKVQADLEHVVVCLDVDWYREGGRGRDERGRLGAEVVIVVLDKTEEPIREGIFAADSNRPAAEGCAGCGNDQSGGTGQAIVVGIFPRAARLHVTEKPIPTITNPASNRRQRLDLGLVRKTPSPRSGPFPHFDAPERAVYIRVDGL